ncbi:hypothetical protein [Pelosinus propionicus]|uniref:Uncharacterized protein n=1 Tax=Pelosinus propionicus DSM 13327 TaxID=1123291 RepID=A0A1I4PAT1_9FIRM|nr:hypothetical protein [Pelosinus propionicus]SFM24871.1 hypothetical protein SAMN04490355_106033 [Pelosinus propionicus DSM 13327]
MDDASEDRIKVSIGKQEASTQTSNLLQESNQALYRIPVFLSYATPYNTLQALFLENITNAIRAALLFPRTLGPSDQYTETPLTSIRRMILSSYGLMAIAFRRSFVTQATSRPGTSRQQVFNDFWLTSPYLQIEPSMAYQRGLPLMLLVEEGVSTNSVFGGILEQGAAPFTIITFNLQNEQAIEAFFNTAFWTETFADWACQVRSGYDRQTEPEFQFTC